MTKHFRKRKKKESFDEKEMDAKVMKKKFNANCQIYDLTNEMSRLKK